MWGVTTAANAPLAKARAMYGRALKPDDYEELLRQRTVGETMDGVGRNLPALMRADKVQAKAARAGFDWDAPEDALVKVSEEAGEVAQALRDRTNVVEELGDLLFACVNVARLAGVDSEQALRAATDKFMDRFTRMERAILDDGKQLTSMTLEQMDEYWDRIKH